MPVQSSDLVNGQERAPSAPRPSFRPSSPSLARAHGFDWSLAAGRLALLLALLPFGVLWWGVNGAYSVQGLGAAAAAFGKTASLWYAIIAAWTFTVPLPPAAAALELPTIQPVLPWLGVASASIFQVVIVVRRGRAPIPLWMAVAAALLSLYDVGTTWYGLGTVRWVAQAGDWFQAGLTAVLTFGLEMIVGYALRQLFRR